MVEINTKEEQNAVEEFLNKATLVTLNLFLGASDGDEEGKSVWKHGFTTVEYSNWASREPNDATNWGEDCTQLAKEKGWKWNNVECGSTHGSVLC